MERAMDADNMPHVARARELLRSNVSISAVG